MTERRYGYRWVVLALLFVATTINYVDRLVLGLLAPTLTRELQWTETDYGNIVSMFTFAYGFGFLFSGWCLDRIGVKKGLTAAIIAWSVAAMAHAFARTVAGFSFARAALGFGESAIFPASIKTVAEWFPQRERALAAGLFNAGTNTGAILAPIIVVFVTERWGWQAAFLVTGAMGVFWLLAWIPLYRPPESHPKVSAAELAHIRSDPSETRHRAVPWLQLLGYRQTWAFIVTKLFADPVWWFYLYWLPKFLDARYEVKLSGVALPLIVIYLIADFGSIGGGWLSSTLIKRGWTPNRARKTAMLAMALLIVPTMLAPRVDSLWGAVLIVALAAAAHQAWSANAYTLASDMFPKAAVGSVVGIGAFAGAVGGFGFQRLVGYVLDANGRNYAPIFVVCGSAYVVGWLLLHFIVPRLQPAPIAGDNPS